MINIIHNENPYVLDYVDNEYKLPALTLKNAKFIEAVVHLDSNYAKDLEVNVPSENYDPEVNAESSQGMYCGSTAYWFNEMKKDNCNFRKCVLGAIIAIDSTNSTHLEAAYSGRKIMRDIICKKCSSYHDLLNMLNIPFDSSNHEHLISLLTKKTIAKKDNVPRYNLSFATKFCAYASIFLNANIKYSKYDNIVSDALPKYVKVYLNKIVNAREFKINSYQRKNLTDEEKYQYRLDVFEKYSRAINEIIESLVIENIFISREELDHIIWYGLK